MEVMSGLTLNLNLETPDRINALFPKCRPRGSSGPPYTHHTHQPHPDINLNTLDALGSLVMDSTTTDRSCDNHSSVLGGGGDSVDEDSSLEESSGDEDEESPPGGGSNLVLQLKSPAAPAATPTATPAATYKLRDSRIIEIAGGREVYCQSRSKSARSKAAHHGAGGVGAGKGGPPLRSKGRGPGDIWQLRSKLHAQCVVEPKQPEQPQPQHADGSTAEVTETVFSNEVSSVKHQRQQSSIGADDGCVVFDDIGPEEWGVGRRPAPRHRSERAGGGGGGGPLSSGGSSPSPPLHHYPFHFSSNHPLFFKQQAESQGHKHSGGGGGEGRGGSSEASISSDSKHSGGAGSSNQKVLGSPVPIAQYEGSPRRYGNCNKLTEPPVLPSLLSSPSVYLPKPGFPQRVLDDESSAGGAGGAPLSTTAPPSPPLPPVQSPGFDYLYEFSETRKVLEEFFKPGDNNINSTGAASSLQFRDLEYELRRQSSLEGGEGREGGKKGREGGKRKGGGTGGGTGGGGGRGSSYVGLRLASDEIGGDRSPRKPSQDSAASVDMSKERDLLSGFSVSTEMLTQTSTGSIASSSGHYHHRHHRHTREGSSRGSDRHYVSHHPPRSSPPSDTDMLGGMAAPSRNFTLSPETTDCESNCGDLDSEISSLVLVMDEVGGSGSVGGGGLTILPLHGGERPYPGMPVLEDGLSSGHASDTENNNPTVLLMKRQISEIEQEIVVQRSHHNKIEEDTSVTGGAGTTSEQALSRCPSTCTTTTTPSPLNTAGGSKKDILDPGDIDLTSLDPLNGSMSGEASEGAPAGPDSSSGSGGGGGGGSLAPPPPRSPPPPAPTPHRDQCVEAALKDIRLTLQRTKALPLRPPPPPSPPLSTPPPTTQVPPGGEQECAPVWVPRKQGGSGPSADEDDADTDLETDRLLGQQRTNDEGYFDDKMAWRKPKTRTYPEPSSLSKALPFTTPPSSACTKLTQSPPSSDLGGSNSLLTPTTNTASTNGKVKKDKDGSGKKKGRNKEGMLHEPAVLIEGVLFRARYLGSTQLVCEGQPTKSTRMMQAEEAVSRIKVESHHAGCAGGAAEDPGIDTGLGPGTMFRLKFLGSVQVDEDDPKCCKRRVKKIMVEEAVLKIKAPEGETQPSTEVDLFISTEKIMVLNTDLKEIMMDHALRTISYIADIGDLVVLMARRRFVSQEVDEPPKISRTPKMICHVFESDEAQFIAQSIGQAFQVAYMEFLKANGIEDHSFVKEMDYQEVLNSQEIFGDELQMFAKKELQKEVVVPKGKGEILGVVIVESGWGSMLPTVVIANLAPAGAAARCGQLNIGDQIIAVNGVSLVGLPLSTCQTYIKNSKNQTVVKLTVVPCAPVVEVKIKRPDTKYQLGFSVQNGVICSLLRGGIAERGGVRVGHRIIEINNQSVVAVPHEKIVNLLATSVGEILMKTMPTSMFRLLTGQETPVFI